MQTAELRLPPTLAHLKHEQQPDRFVATVARPGDLLYRQEGGWALIVSVADHEFRRGLSLDEDGSVAVHAAAADLNDSDEVILTAHADWERGYPVGTPGSWLIAHLSGDELVTLRRRLN